MFVGAWAEESPYGLTICNVPVTDTNKNDLIAVINSVDGCSATGTMSYDSETQTLNLNGVTAKAYINTKQKLTIESIGNNELSYPGYVINANDQNLTFAGNGSLKVKGTGSVAALYFLTYSSSLVIDHTTVEIEDTEGIINDRVVLKVIESTFKAYQLKVYSISLTNSLIQKPAGANIKSVTTPGMISSTIMDGSEMAKNIEIVPDQRVEPELEWQAVDDWDPEYLYSWNKTKLLEFFYPQNVSPAVLVNKYNVAVQYESSNPEAIQIDATKGAITVIKPGEATITASFSGNSEYKPASVAYTYSCQKGRPDITFAESSYKATIGKEFTSPTPSIKNILGQEITGFALAYESSDEMVATVNEEGIITPLKKGETTIKVWLAENDFYVGGTAGQNGCYGMYKLTVVDPGTTLLQFPETEYRVAANGTFTAPKLTNPDNVSVVYNSSDEAVASVDAATGAVTIHKAGATTITAAFAGNDDFQAASASYTLIVQKISASISFPQLEYKVAITEKASFEAPKATTNPEGLTLTYSSSDETVATVNATTGAVTVLKLGETTIKADFAGSDIYDAVSGSYKLIVEKEKAKFSFSATTATTTFGDTFTAPTLQNDQKLEVTYSSSDTKVATVDVKTGAVTILAAGKTTITASFAGNDQYEAAKASYELTVEPGAIDKENTVTVGNETLYKPAGEVATAMTTVSTNNVALSEGANSRTTVDAAGNVIFAEGADLKMAILGVEAGKAVKITFEGTIEAEGLTEAAPASSRRAPLALNSGKEYIAQAGGNILLTLKTSAGTVKLSKLEVINATGIRLINADGTPAKRYNLRGQRVDESYKGIVIINGKKVVVK